MTPRYIILTNGTVVTDGRRTEGGYLVIEPPFIVAVGQGKPDDVYLADAIVHDLGGALVLPGAIDCHVHFRDPGLTHKASIASESASAVAGGVTSFLDMPNTKPATTTVEAVRAKKHHAALHSRANYGFFIGATNDNLDQILSIDPSEIPGVKLFMGSSTGNMLVDNRSTIDRLCAEYKGVVAVHAEDERTIALAREELLDRYGENAPVSLHSALRSSLACMEASTRAVRHARQDGTRLHLCHISTADELALLDPSADVAAKQITSETAPHYLLFTDDMLADTPEGYLKKCNPAIKSDRDRQALRRAIVDGTIDMIATDHAPHLMTEKEGTLWKAASGMPGVRFMLPLMLELTHHIDGLTLERVVGLTAHNPATIYKIDRRGYIRPGYFADLAIVRPGAFHTITHADSVSHLPEELRPGCRWTPYAGLRTRYFDITTMVNGGLASTPAEGVMPQIHAMPLIFNQP